MARLCATVLFVGLLAAQGADPRPTNAEYKKQKAADKAKADAKAADEGKTAAVDKVIAMLETLSAKVQAEGESEAASYNKFSCFCKTTQAEKTDAIQKGKDDKASLTANINKLSTGRKTDDTSITAIEKTIKDTEDDMAKAVKDNEADLKVYGAEKEDLSSAISSITNALKTLKASKPSLMQLKSASGTVREAMAMADALGLGVDSMTGPTAALLQGDAPEVEMENYKFHAGGVIETLEKLLDTFRGKKTKSDAEEVKRLSEHDMAMQSNTDIVKAKNLELSQTQKARDDKIAEIASDSQKLSTTSADLLDDQEYLNELYKSCSQKASSWDKRSQVRSDELSALTAATTIIKGAVREKTSSSTLRFAQRGVSVRLAQAVARDESAMDVLEEAAEEKEAAPSAFLQRRAVSRHSSNDPVDKIAQLLKMTGLKTKSAMLTGLAAEISTGNAKPKGMEKIKTLIEELIKRLQAEAANEATQKGFCDKNRQAAITKQRTTGQDVDELNSKLAKLEADRSLLTEKLATLKADIKELNDAKDDADALRKKEKGDNEEAIKEAGEGKKAVESAVAILEKFYKDAAKKTSEADKADKKIVGDAPDGGFADGEAYKGDQSAATGVLGMLEVITSDFDRTIKETTKAETEAVQDHAEFTDQTTTSIKEKETAEKARKKEKSDADASYDSDTESLKKKTDLLVSTIEELLELKKACIDTAMSYEERVERREEEIASLRKALCILSEYASGSTAENSTC
jgi:hypothetical protein